MNAGDHRPPRRAAALGCTPAALGHRRWPASRPQVLGGERRRRAPAADGSLVNAFARAGRWHGVHSRPPQASGDQGDAGSCDPNWGQSVSPPPYQLDGPPGRRPCPAGEHTARRPQVFGCGGSGAVLATEPPGAARRPRRLVRRGGALERGRLDAVDRGAPLHGGYAKERGERCPPEAAPHRQPVANLGNEPVGRRRRGARRKISPGRGGSQR